MPVESRPSVPAPLSDPDVAARCAAFRALHERCFVIPNPWDRGSAVFLAQLGFRALASSSAGFAFSCALPDSPHALSRAHVLAHVADLVAATPLPVSADFQAGYGDDPEAVAASVRLCLQTGVAGLSIEDASGTAGGLFDLPHAVARVTAARAAIDEARSGAVLTARAETLLVDPQRGLDDVLTRLRAYADAGADVLYAPGLRERDAIRRVVEAVAPKPVNVLVGSDLGLRVADLEALGVRRISVGSALARTAWTAFAKAARAIASDGDFSAFAGLLGTRELSEHFA